MMIFVFYLFVICVCVVGFMVVIGCNLVYLVLWFILVFFFVVGLFVL